MNRIYNYMKSQLKNIKFNKDDSEFDYTLLMHNPKPNIDGNKTYPKIVETLLKLKKEYGVIAKENSMENANGEYDDEIKDEYDFKYRIFNNYARKELLSLCTSKNKMDRDKLLDYLVYAHYYDKNISRFNDKNILWNCFGNEFNKRLKDGTDVKFKEIDIEKNDKAIKKIKSKYMHKIKSDASTVQISIFEPQNSDQEPKAIELFDSDFKLIKDKCKTPNERKMALVIMTLERFCNAYEKKFNINSYKKDVIVKSHIYKLAAVHSRDYEETLKKLVEDEIIDIELGRNDTVLTCKVLSESECEGKTYKLTNVNQCKKYLKKVA